MDRASTPRLLGANPSTRVSGTGSHAAVGGRDIPARASSSVHGFTLVEMLVSLLILGVLLSAAAASLITFTQTARTNERQVQATAVLNRAVEEFQAFDWEVLGTLDDDITATATVITADGTDLAVPLDDDRLLGARLDVEDRLFTDEDGVTREIVVAEDPDDAIDLYSGIFTAEDGRDYELFQVVTWVDTTGDANPDLKRLTAIVRWWVGTRSFEQIAVTDRAPSVQEVGDFTLPRLLQYDLFPRVQELAVDPTDPLRTTAPSSITVGTRWSEGVANVRVAFFEVDVAASQAAGETVLVERTVNLLPSIEDPSGPGHVYLVGTIPAGTYVFPVGPRPVRVIAELPLDPTSAFEAASRSLLFTSEEPAPWPEVSDPGTVVDPGDDDGDGDGGGDDGLDPELGSVSIGPVIVNSPDRPARLDNSGGNRLLCESFSVTAQNPSGLLPGDVVELVFFTGSSGNTETQRSIDIEAGPLPPLTWTFQTDTDYQFRNNNETAFTVRVRRESAIVGSWTNPDPNSLTNRLSFTNANNCR